MTRQRRPGVFVHLRVRRIDFHSIFRGDGRFDDENLFLRVPAADSVLRHTKQAIEIEDVESG